MLQETSLSSTSALQESTSVPMDTDAGVTMQKNVSHRQWLQQWLSNAPISTEHHLKTQCMLLALQLKLSQ